jgi:hypothetical protein
MISSGLRSPALSAGFSRAGSWRNTGGTPIRSFWGTMEGGDLSDRAGATMENRRNQEGPQKTFGDRFESTTPFRSSKAAILRF